MQIGQAVTTLGDQQLATYLRSMTHQLSGVPKGNKQSQHQQLKQSILRSLKRRRNLDGFGTYSKNWVLKASSQKPLFSIRTIKEQSGLRSIQAHSREQNLLISSIIRINAQQVNSFGGYYRRAINRYPRPTASSISAFIKLGTTMFERTSSLRGSVGSGECCAMADAEE
jgi:hypothetical protein